MLSGLVIRRPPMQGSPATQDEAGTGREVAAVHTAQEEAASCECHLENGGESIWFGRNLVPGQGPVMTGFPVS